MAFKDSDGRITIDEVAAEKDIKQLQASIEKMNAAIEGLNEIQIQTDDFSGNTGTRIREAAAELISELKQSIQATEESIGLIQATVAKYQRLDQEMKNTVNQTRQ